jgi:transposase
MFQRPAGGNLSLEQKASIIALQQRNVPTRQIALEIGCQRSTALKLIRNYRENFDVWRKVGSGSPRKTTAAQDARLSSPRKTIYNFTRTKKVFLFHSILIIIFNFLLYFYFLSLF